MTKSEKMILSLLAAVSAIGSMLLASPDADASPLSFLQSLNNRGISVYDTSKALGTGLAICQTLETYNGADVAEAVYQVGGDDVPTRDVAVLWLVTAVEELCPWQDHRNELVAR